MTPSDAESVCSLSEQLGYSMPVSTTQNRILTVLDQPGHCAFVGEQDGVVVGWIHLYISHIIESTNSHVEIGGLVVDEACRGQGIGKALVQAGENWTLKCGLLDIRLRSAVKRIDAHAFYEKLGYQLVKTQMRFQKKLSVEN
jgi:GNAT superfamily N-acetyltransferase